MEKFETEKLIFTLYSEKLRGDFTRLFTDEEVMKYVDKGVLSREAVDALWRRLVDEFYPKGIKTIWAVLAKEDGRFIANASIRPRPEYKHETEIGYVLAKNEWGKGYATEIAMRLVAYGFEELKLKTVYATVDTGNEASKRVLEKCGMSVVRTEYDEQGKFYVYGIKR
ncbi:MAG TPA: GNAT family N-acetyltransferase [Pyrinomonadaceae bacterium]|jgi:RimJ/RimL family protein N-acetyltransferase|nr:GNAT family N-acetyltransferase [Pyrinomonadaceae bacterium]